MGSIAISGGGPTANVRAAVDLAADRLFKFSTTRDNEVELCGSGEEADGICLEASAADELLNVSGLCQMRKQQGIYADVAINAAIGVGSEIMSDSTGQIIAYVNSGDNRPLGKMLSATGAAAETAKILIYAR